MKAMITATLVFSYYWKILAPFCLQKKRPKNSFLTLTVNYCKIVQKNKLYHSKLKIGYLIIYDVIYSLFRLKKWHFSTNSCIGLLYP